MIQDILADTEHYFSLGVLDLHPDKVLERHVHLVARNPHEEAWSGDMALVVRKAVARWELVGQVQSGKGPLDLLDLDGCQCSRPFPRLLWRVWKMLAAVADPVSENYFQPDCTFLLLPGTSWTLGSLLYLCQVCDTKDRLALADYLVFLIVLFPDPTL